jgi:peptide/nickel transport system permease protein
MRRQRTAEHDGAGPRYLRILERSEVGRNTLVNALVMPMNVRKMIRRVAVQAIPTILGIIALNFLFLNLMPGDAADAIAGMSGSATAETMNALRKSLGLDQSLLTQLITYICNVATLNLGTSSNYGAPVIAVIMERLPNTLLLMLTAFVLSLGAGVLIGWIMAVFANRWPDRLLTTIVLLLYSAPGFWLGMMAVVLFSARLGWLPSGGSETIGASLTGLALVRDHIVHLILPAAALACFFVAIYARLTRAAMLEVLRQDFMRAAAAKGLHPIVLQFRHALRNALIPVTTIAGLHLANLLSGAVVVETVFDWPGLGRLILNSLVARDFNVLLGILLLSSVIVIVINIAIDCLMMWLDPRIEA